jgi:hypothetical protein
MAHEARARWWSLLIVEHTLTAGSFVGVIADKSNGRTSRQNLYLQYFLELRVESSEAQMKTKTCPDCNGDGVLDKGTDDEHQCPTCGGCGFVPADDDDDDVLNAADSPQFFAKFGS